MVWYCPWKLKWVEEEEKKISEEKKADPGSDNIILIAGIYTINFKGKYNHDATMK